MQSESLSCSICDRTIPHKIWKEKHHLIPRCKRGKEKIPVCVDCGNQIHQLFSIKELRDTYNTVETLKQSERLQTWIRWIRNKSGFGFCMKAKKRK